MSLVTMLQGLSRDIDIHGISKSTVSPVALGVVDRASDEQRRKQVLRHLRIVKR
jgi:hypothetical protein